MSLFNDNEIAVLQSGAVVIQQNLEVLRGVKQVIEFRAATVSDRTVRNGLLEVVQALDQATLYEGVLLGIVAGLVGGG